MEEGLQGSSIGLVGGQMERPGCGRELAEWPPYAAAQDALDRGY